MSDHTSILCRQDREIVEGIIRGDIPLVDNNDLVIRRIIERMWVELEGWHKMAWLWADMRVSGEPVQPGVVSCTTCADSGWQRFHHEGIGMMRDPCPDCVKGSQEVR